MYLPFDIETVQVNTKAIRDKKSKKKPDKMFTPYGSVIVSYQLGDRFYENPGTFSPKFCSDTVTLPSYGDSLMSDEVLEEIFDPKSIKLIHNAYFEQSFMYEFHGQMIPKFEDTMLAAKHIMFCAMSKYTPEDPEEDDDQASDEVFRTYELKELARQRLGMDVSPYDAIKKTYKNIGNVTSLLYLKMYNNKDLFGLFKQYALADNEYTPPLWDAVTKHELWPKARGAYHADKETLAYLVKMSSRGLKISEAETVKQAELAGSLMAVRKKQLEDLVGRPVKINGNKDAGQALVDLGVPLKDKDKDGHYYTNKQVLNSLQHLEPVRLLKEARQLLTNETKFLQWLRYADVNGRIHPTYRVFGADHGRMSCHDPNLMGMTKRGVSDIHKELKPRKCFIPEDGFDFYMFDYSQQELVGAAYVTNSKLMIKEIKEKIDLHSLRATETFGELVNKQTATPEYWNGDTEKANTIKKYRDTQKNGNFAMAYECGYRRLATTLAQADGVSVESMLPIAKKMHGVFHAAYPEMKAASAICKERLLTDEQLLADHERFRALMIKTRQWNPEFKGRKYAYRGYVQGIFGQLWSPPDPSKHYRALNALISGPFTGHLTKWCIRKIMTDFAKRGLQSFIILPVHDELIFQVKHGEEDVVLPLIKKHMEFCPKITKRVPLTVEATKGLGNLADKKSIEVSNDIG